MNIPEKAKRLRKGFKRYEKENNKKRKSSKIRKTYR